MFDEIVGATQCLDPAPDDQRMFPTLPLHTDTLSLDELIARLFRHDGVDGLLLMGSPASALTPDSDYDLLLVVSHAPPGLHLVLTTVDRRLTEVYVETTARIDQLVSAAEPVRPHSFEGTLVTWLRDGTIVFDRNERLRHAQRLFQRGPWSAPPSDGDVYRTWFHINYNVTQTKRMLHANDPLYHTTVDVRLLYTVHDLLVGYLKVRKLPWHGDKAALQYVQAHDLNFFECFQQCLAETDPLRKFALYTQLAALTLAPVGGLWPDDVTAVQFAEGVHVQPEVIDAALNCWACLVADNGNGQG
jgi:hypothetical protein